MSTPKHQGLVISKTPTLRGLETAYRCGECFATVIFHNEEKQYCPGCHTLYQTRMMVGRPQPKKE